MVLGIGCVYSLMFSRRMGLYLVINHFVDKVINHYIVIVRTKISFVDIQIYYIVIIWYIMYSENVVSTI